MPTRQLPRYQAYLLRFWEESQPSDLPRVWRFSLQDPHTGERRGFADLEHLLDFLNEQMNTTNLPGFRGANLEGLIEEESQ